MQRNDDSDIYWFKVQKTFNIFYSCDKNVDAYLFDRFYCEIKLIFNHVINIFM